MQRDPGLTPEHNEELEKATRRARKIRGAARVASFNGWTIGFFATITILFSLRSPPALALGIGMAIVARNEFRGRGQLHAFDPEGASLLGRNQLGFLALIVLYCLWTMGITLTRPSPDAQDVSELLAMIGESEDLMRTLTITVYVTVIVASVIFQGLNARYYFVRRAIIESYLQETPQWIVDLQRS